MRQALQGVQPARQQLRRLISSSVLVSGNRLRAELAVRLASVLSTMMLPSSVSWTGVYLVPAAHLWVVGS